MALAPNNEQTFDTTKMMQETSDITWKGHKIVGLCRGIPPVGPSWCSDGFDLILSNNSRGISKLSYSLKVLYVNTGITPINKELLVVTGHLQARRQQPT